MARLGPQAEDAAALSHGAASRRISRRQLIAGAIRLRVSDLAQNCLVLDCLVVGQQKCLAEDYAQHRVSLEGQGNSRGAVAGTSNDAEVAAARFHDDVAAAQMNAIFVRFAAD